MIYAEAASPCCNYREVLDLPCDGTAWLYPGRPVYVCDRCGAQCGRIAHPSCVAAVERYDEAWRP